jgi:glycosyltransferase involved in cell wall biosynthesis
MKIVTVTNYYPPFFIGGYEIACKDTMDFLKMRGHEVVVVTSDYQTTQSEAEDIIRTMRLTNYATSTKLEKKQDEAHNYQVVLDVIKRVKPDLVYFWSLRGIGLKVIQATDMLEIPKIFEIGDFWMYGYMKQGSKIKQTIKKMLPVWNEEKVSISPTICVSNWVAKEMKERYGSQHTHVIPNATTLPTTLPPKPEAFIFAFAGRIGEDKGLHLAVSALVRFAQVYPEASFQFNIYGEGDEEYITYCKKLANPISERVYFRGKVEKKEEIYANASILLMPTMVRDAFGLVVIEAMAHKCAVIATNAYGPAEIIEHGKNGLLFEKGDVTDLFEQIKKLYFDTTHLKQLQEEGYRDVEKHYALPKVKQQVEKILKEIAGV